MDSTCPRGAEEIVRLDAPEQEKRVLILRAVVGLEPATLDEFRTWARCGPGASDVRTSIDSLLTFDGLTAAAMSGVVGGAAWSVFPAAARWLAERRRAAHVISASDAAEVVRKCLDVIEPGSADRLRIDQLDRKPDGSWLVTVHANRRGYRLEVDASGEVVQVVKEAS